MSAQHIVMVAYFFVLMTHHIKSAYHFVALVAHFYVLMCHFCKMMAHFFVMVTHFVVLVAHFMTQVQYRCGNDYSNAVFYTDSLNFCIFIGVYIPGSFENDYTVKRNTNGSFDFYNLTGRQKVDTVRVEKYLLTNLKKGKFSKVCK